MPRRLLARLRELMARGAAPLSDLVRLVANEMVAEVCSVYVIRPGEILELTATEGLRPEAIGRTRLRVGEGIVGLVAAQGEALNLPDAQNHPAFAYRSETGEEPYASLLGVPVRRAGRVIGVLTVQNRNPRLYDDDEVDVMETVAMLLAEMLTTAGASDRVDEGINSEVPGSFSATVLVGGIAIGSAVIHGGTQAPRRLLAEDSEAELRRLKTAEASMRHGLDRLISTQFYPADGLVSPDAEASREILAAYRLIAADEGWMRRVGDAIRGGLSAEAAVQRVLGELRDRMRRISDPYLRERLSDLEDLAGRLLLALDGGEPVAVPAGAILLARRLGPAELLDWYARGIAGVVMEEGSAAGHAAVVARALSIPTLAGARGVMDAVDEGDEVIIDADDGEVIVRPGQDVRQVYMSMIEARGVRQAGWAAMRDRPTTTRDGTPVRLMLNVGLTLELAQLDLTGAEGIGLFRTEIAMLARGEVVDVTEQASIYSRVLDFAGKRPVLFRTLDLGGDKLLPGSVAREENPAMGWRSLRIGLDRPALLRRQLRALLIAASGRPLSVMFPMVATLDEFRTARALLLAEVARADPRPASLSIGTMLEIPALMWQLPDLMKEADFVSIGTNDLMQFTFAADRGTPSIAGRYDWLSPPALAMLAQVQEAAATADVSLSVCGEVAGRPLEAMTIVGLGITTLSMPASGVLAVKALLAELDLVEFRAVLKELRRTAAGAASLRNPLGSWARERGLPV